MIFSANMASIRGGGELHCQVGGDGCVPAYKRAPDHDHWQLNWPALCPDLVRQFFSYFSLAMCIEQCQEGHMVNAVARYRNTHEIGFKPKHFSQE